MQSFKKLKEHSRFLAKVLRHDPKALNLSLDKEGYANVKEILNGLDITIEDLYWIVENNDKKRFAFNSDETKIRASQGHSVDNINIKYDINVDSELKALYHGTSLENKESILKNGLIKGKRTHVHLSKDLNTAFKVGQRKGQSTIIFEINTRMMRADGIKLFVSENDVYLVDYIAPKYIKLL